MKVLIVAAVLSIVGYARAADLKPPQPRSGTMPPQQSFIGLSLMDALVAVQAENLAGVFGYVSEANAAPAFADYLFRNPKQLKLFLKKGESDLKRVGGINEWDKEVFLYLVTMNSNAALVGTSPMSTKSFDRVATLSLVQGVPLATIKMGGQR